MAKLALISLFIISYMSLSYGSPIQGSNGTNFGNFTEIEFQNNGTNETEIDGFFVNMNNPLFSEGDMRKSPDEGVMTRTLIDKNAARWPKGEVYYQFKQGSYGAADKKKIQAAMRLMQTTLGGNCIKFIHSAAKHYIQFDNQQGCWSQLGRSGVTGENWWDSFNLFGSSVSSQDLSLQKPGCLGKGTVIHELMHAIGFHHEQNRPDRDQYMTINWNNMKADARGQFEKRTWDNSETYQKPYDINSVMQYPNYAFSSNGRDTMTVKNNPSYKIPHPSERSDANVMSPTDIYEVKKLYGC